MEEKSILLFADRLPPLIGGMEIHARYFIEHFSNHVFLPLIGIITKTENDEDYLISNHYKDIINISNLPNLLKPTIVFFNSGRWIEKLAKLRNLFPTAVFIYRTGGNEILKAPVAGQNIPNHKSRQAYWVSSLNSSVDLMITNSRFTEGRLLELGITCPFFRCVGGVNIDALKPKHNCPKKNSLSIFCAARFVPYKNHSLLIAVVHELMLRGHDIKLRLAGDGPLLTEVKQQVEEKNLWPMVEFLGAVNNETVCQEIANADIYMQFSEDYLTKVPGGEYIHSEGMGRSILEALSAGTFIIAGKSGALSEIIDGKNGFLIETNDLMFIVDKIEQILTQLPANQAVSEDYSWQKLFERYERLMIRLAK